MLDFDPNGRLVSIELLAVRARWPETTTRPVHAMAVERAQALVRHYVPEDVSSSEELIRDRRAEARRS